MADPSDEEIRSLRESVDAVSKLAADPQAFDEAFDAYIKGDAGRFREILERLGLLDLCPIICRFFCHKHCVAICRRFCGDAPAEPLNGAEVRAFTEALQRLVRDEDALHRLLDIIRRDDAAAWKRVIERLDFGRFCHQLCHFLCRIHCHLRCFELCPPNPLITKIDSVPISQIDPQGFGNGPGDPMANVPLPNPAGGVGDHPFGGVPDVFGIFNMPTATEYKVEISDNPGGPYDPIAETLHGTNNISVFPWTIPCTRTPSGGADPGWYQVADICDSHGGPNAIGWKMLVTWPTAHRPDGTYFLRLRVRDGTTERVSSPQIALTDNTPPPMPVIKLELETPEGERKELKCGKVSRGEGLVAVTVKAFDLNFSRLSVAAQGNSGLSVPVVDTGGNPLSKTYNGNKLDQGYPVETTFLWDPWSDPRIVPCCYVVRIDIWDRALSSNVWAGGHGNAGWEAIEIGF
jgi:hypothetical protein